MKLVFLLDVAMIPAGPFAPFTVVTAEDGGQLLLGHAVGGQRDGALLSEAAAILDNKAHAQERSEHLDALSISTC